MAGDFNRRSGYKKKIFTYSRPENIFFIQLFVYSLAAKMLSVSFVLIASYLVDLLFVWKVSGEGGGGIKAAVRLFYKAG